MIMSNASIDSVMTGLMDVVRSKTGKNTTMSIPEATASLKAIEDPIIAITVRDNSNSSVSGVYILNKDTKVWAK